MKVYEIKPQQDQVPAAFLRIVATLDALPLAQRSRLRQLLEAHFAARFDLSLAEMRAEVEGRALTPGEDVTQSPDS